MRLVLVSKAPWCRFGVNFVRESSRRSRTEKAEVRANLLPLILRVLMAVEIRVFLAIDALR
jgi:hypothetical protein